MKHNIVNYLVCVSITCVVHLSVKLIVSFNLGVTCRS